MSNLTERLRRQLTISMFATKDDLYGALHDDRDQAADRIEHLERVLAQAREAIEDSDVRVYELCSTFSVPEPQATRDRAAKAISAIDEALGKKKPSE